MDLYEEALYAQAVRERQRRVAMQREIELRRQQQVEAMMQRMAIESAMRDYTSRLVMYFSALCPRHLMKTPAKHATISRL